MFPDHSPKTVNCRGLGQTPTILGQSDHMSGGSMAKPAASICTEVVATGWEPASIKINWVTLLDFLAAL